ARLRAANGAGQRGRADALTQLYLQSIDARDIAVLQAWKKLRPGKRRDVKKLPEIAEHLDAWQGTDEPVILSFNPMVEEGSEVKFGPWSCDLSGAPAEPRIRPATSASFGKRRMSRQQRRCANESHFG